MLTSDLDVYRAARLLIDQHEGDKNLAILDAATRADDLLDKGDLDGQAVWKRIVRAIKKLQDQQPPGAGEAVH